ncbi:hypothetical protein, partial [Sutterella wadsworthensis]|uniref:hypothetical protein n=1 Tax=Sutterella wadsworthensis TaxID=40545 RepID=UPI0019D2FD0E
GFKKRRIAEIDADQYKYGSAIREFRRKVWITGEGALMWCAFAFLCASRAVRSSRACMPPVIRTQQSASTPLSQNSSWLALRLREQASQ